MTGGTPPRTTMSWSRIFALGTGGVYLILGMSGFLFAGHGALGVFGAGPVLNIVRTAIGLLGLVVGFRASAPQAFGWVLFVGLVGFTVFGVLVAATGRAEDVNGVLLIHPADNWLHGATAVIGLVTGFLPARGPRRPVPQ